MSMRRTVGLGAAILLHAAILPCAGAAWGDEGPGAAGGETPWAAIELELEQVLRSLDPALDRGPASFGAVGRGDLADRVESVLADWRWRRSRPPAAGEAEDGSPAVPEPVVAALQRLAAGLHRARRLAGRPGADAAAAAAALQEQVTALRLLAAKHRHGRTAAAPLRSLASTSTLTNDDCAAAIAIGEGSHAGTTTGATNGGSASCGSSGFSPDVWYVYTAATAAETIFDTVGSSYDTVLSLHSGCPGTTANELACNDDHFGLQSRVSREMAAGEQVWIRVSGFNGQAGSFVLKVAAAQRISGRVTDSSTGDPLPGAEVWIFGDSFDIATTAADGRYSSGALPDGDYFAWASSPEHVAELYDDIQCLGLQCNVTVGTPIVLTAGAGAQDIDFALDPGASISGTVVDAATSSPLQNLTVAVYSDSGTLLKFESTAADGTYRASGLPAGSFRARTFSAAYISELYDDLPCPFSCDPTTGTAISVAAATETTGIDFALDLGGSITGTVTDEVTGDPLLGLHVVVADGSFNQRSAFTSSTGAYTVGGLPAGTYFARTFSATHLDELYHDLPCEPFCNPTNGTPIPVAQGLVTSGIHFALARPISISGTVRDAVSASPLVAVPVTAYDDHGRAVGSSLSGFDGSYLLNGSTGNLRILAGPTTTHAAQFFGGLPFGLDALLGLPIFFDQPIAGLDLHVQPLGECGFPQDLDLSSVSIVWAAEVAACDTLHVGPAVMIAGGGRAVFRAGGQVSLGNGVSVEAGGRLAIASGSVLPPPVENVVYREDFEDGFALGWDNSNRLTDLWRIDAGCSTPPSGSKTLSFSRSLPDCDYALAAAVPFGWARSPILDLSGAATATLQLVHRFETEGGSTWDQMAIQASSNAGGTWTTVWTRVTAATAGFVVESVDVSGFIGPRFRFRFVFDAVDSILNDFGGWSIDEVMVTVD